MRHRTRSYTALTALALAVAAGCGSGEPAGSGTDEIAAPATTDASTETTEPAADETAAAPTTRPEDVQVDGEDEAVENVEAGGDDPDVVTSPDAAPGVIEVSLTDAERAAADDPIAQAITSAFPPGFTPPSEEQARCVGGKIVNELGPDRLAELGITAESIDVFGGTDFTADEVDTMVDVLFECVDVEFMVASMFAPSAGPETAECFADFVDEQLIRDLATPFLGGGAIDADFFLEQVQAANTACLSTDG